MKKDDPLKLFLPQKSGIDGFADDIDGEADDAWHEAIKKYVPEILWNPDQRAKTEKGGQGSGNWGHGGLAGVHGGSSPKKGIGKFIPSTKKINFDETTGSGASQYVSPSSELLASGNVPLFSLGKYFDKDKLAQVNNKLLREHIKKQFDDMSPEEFENYRSSIEWIADTAGGLQGEDPETGYKVFGDFETEFYPSEEGYANMDMQFEGEIFDRDNNPIGEIQISMTLKDGDDYAYIDLFRFYNQSTQGGGFGKRYMSNAEDVLFAMGASRIELEAALTVGGYFWARAGYDFRYQRGYHSDLSNLKGVLADEWEHQYGENVPQTLLDNIVHSWDLAATVGPDGTKIGKQVMLGSHWMGIKGNPDFGWDDTDGYEIGKEYYDG